MIKYSDYTYEEMNENDINEFNEARLKICSYCKQTLETDIKDCSLCHLKRMAKAIYNNSPVERNIDVNSEEAMKYLFDFEDFNEDDSDYALKLESDPLYRKHGVYAIYLDKIKDDNILYVGKATNIIERWKTHANSIFLPKEREEKKYAKLRDIYKNGNLVIFKVLEFCNNDKIDTLKQMEDKWILKYMPPFNTTIPNGRGGYTTKQIKDVEYDRLEGYREEELERLCEEAANKSYEYYKNYMYDYYGCYV